MMLAVCNGQMYGGGYCAAPHASMADGLLDVVLLKPIPRLKLPGLLGGYKRGEHLAAGDAVTEKFKPYLTFFRTSKIDIEVLDGNPLITTLDGRVLAPADDARGSCAQCDAHPAAARLGRNRKQDACSGRLWESNECLKK